MTKAGGVARKKVNLAFPVDALAKLETMAPHGKGYADLLAELIHEEYQRRQHGDIPARLAAVERAIEALAAQVQALVSQGRGGAADGEGLPGSAEE